MKTQSKYNPEDEILIHIVLTRKGNDYEKIKRVMESETISFKKNNLHWWDELKRSKK